MCLIHTNHITDNFSVNSRFRVMVFNATFNNISVISWRLVLLVKETRVPKKTTNQVTRKIQIEKSAFIINIC
jgi:hypothetical protein